MCKAFKHLQHLYGYFVVGSVKSQLSLLCRIVIRKLSWHFAKVKLGNMYCIIMDICAAIFFLLHLFEPVRDKTNNLGFRPGLTQTGLYKHRRWLEAGNFGFRK